VPVVFLFGSGVGVSDTYCGTPLLLSGVYILKNTPPPPGGKISADVIWGKKYEKLKRKRGKMYKKKEEREKKKEIRRKGKKMRKEEVKG
jgi:hypothetical protein